MPLEFNSFPKGGLEVNGLNNASVLTFTKDIIDSVIKEMTQNSIDALREDQSTVKISIRMIKVCPAHIPQIESLQKILGQMISYWENQEQKVSFINSLKEALNMLTKDSLNVFVFEDFNTRGLKGNLEKDSFKRLICDEGVQGFKPDVGSLGGFGIGKNALFAFSNPLHTVFYNSFNEEGCKFMGVTKLTEYNDENGVFRCNRIYYGNWTNNNPTNAADLNYVSESHMVPDIFNRSEYGLSSYAIGVEESENWKTLVIQSLINNYWFHFLKGGIEVQITDLAGTNTVLNMESFKQVAIEHFIDANDKSVLAYIEAFLNPQEDGELVVDIGIHEFGEIKIHLREQDDESDYYPDKILYVRDGMKIKEEAKQVGNLPKKIAGVIFCQSRTGNRILSLMEPPAHNDFQPSLLPFKTQDLKEKDGKEILDKIRAAKREAIENLKEKYFVATKSSAIVDEILSGFSSPSAAGAGFGRDQEVETEQFYKKKVVGGQDPIAAKSTVVLSHKPIPGGGAAKMEKKPQNHDPEKRPRDNDNPSKGKRHKNSSGNYGRRGANYQAGAEIDLKMFFVERAENESVNKYILVARTNVNLENVKILVSQYGDEGGQKSLSSKLVGVTDSDGNSINWSVQENQIILEANLLAESQNVFYLSFKETNKSAFVF